MNYIVLDLEWNQSPDGKEKEEKALPFEIIEIGAVKLNERLEEVGQFQEFIRPAVYLSLNQRTQQLLKINMRMLENARPFPQVAEDFFQWCGKDVSYCTWGPGDLLELQRNLKFHGLKNPFPKPLFYYDIQKLYSQTCENAGERRTLEHCIDALQIPKEQRFHDALSDACYTCSVMRHLNFQDLSGCYSIDYYQNPRTRKEEICAVYNDYSKFVSKEFPSRIDVMRDRKVLSVHCPICNKSAKKKIRWFLTGSKNYFCLACCPEHGWLRGKIHIKKTDRDTCFCVKTIRQVSQEDARELVHRHAQIQFKHRQKAIDNVQIKKKD